MTFLMIEDALTDEQELAQQNNQTVKCSWCGEIIRLDGKELALAMCQACYEQNAGRVSARATDASA
jgi:formylmethanofuran dehydrogenase subunit E